MAQLKKDQHRKLNNTYAVSKTMEFRLACTIDTYPLTVQGTVHYTCRNNLTLWNRLKRLFVCIN